MTKAHLTHEQEHFCILANLAILNVGNSEGKHRRQTFDSVVEVGGRENWKVNGLLVMSKITVLLKCDPRGILLFPNIISVEQMKEDNELAEVKEMNGYKIQTCEQMWKMIHQQVLYTSKLDLSWSCRCIENLKVQDWSTFSDSHCGFIR